MPKCINIYKKCHQLDSANFGSTRQSSKALDSSTDIGIFRSCFCASVTSSSVCDTFCKNKMNYNASTLEKVHQLRQCKFFGTWYPLECLFKPQITNQGITYFAHIIGNIYFFWGFQLILLIRAVFMPKMVSQY